MPIVCNRSKMSSTAEIPLEYLKYDGQVRRNFANLAITGPGASTGPRGHRVCERNRGGTHDAAEGPSGTGFMRRTISYRQEEAPGLADAAPA